MSEGCVYFESDRWAELIWTHLAAVETLESFLDKYTHREEIEEHLVDFEDHLGVSYTDLLEMDLREVLIECQDLLSIDPHTVPPVWARLQGLPKTCPHERHGDSQFCLLHHPANARDSSGPSSEELTAYIRDCLDETTGVPSQLAGTTVDNLDLSQVTDGLRNNTGFDFRFIEVNGSLSLTELEVQKPLDLRGSIVDSIEASGAVFFEPVDLSGMSLDGEANFEHATFRARLDGHLAEISDANFDEAIFHQRADFEGATFTGSAHFRRANFHARGYFKSASFETAKFKRVTFHEKASFKHAHFRSKATFPRARFDQKASFKYARFEEESDFEVTWFGSEARFWDVRFGGEVWFTDAQFTDVADFSLAGFMANTSDSVVAKFNGANFQDQALFNAVRTSHDGLISLTGATVTCGRITQPDGYRGHVPDDCLDSTPTYFDLGQSVIGNVEFLPRSDPALFSYFNIDRTEFEDFDFGAHRKALNHHWRIHRFDGPTTTTSFDVASRDRYRVSPDPYVDRDEGTDTIEETYLKAKNGASNAGASQAASEFFLHEMRYRRRNHRRQMFASDTRWYMRPLWFGRWVTSWLFNISCGYGERPGRTVLSSLVIVVLFGGIYQMTGIPGVDSSNWLTYLTFSFQVFVTLVLDGPPTGLGSIGAFLSSIEAFLGAFLIALFVFALTRSVHR